MKFFQRNTYFVLAWIAFALFAAPAVTFAQTDEIQVYDAVIAEKGKINLMIHSNFIASGQKTPAFPGGLIPNHSFNGTAEWAWGVTDWFEQGLYLPVYTIYSQGRGGSINGFKIRELFVRPHADDHTFFYGVNFEFSVNYSYWESRHITSEVRPIVGLHLHKVDFILIRSWIQTMRADSETSNSFRQRVSLITSMINGPLPSRNIPMTALCTTSSRCVTNFTKSGPLWITTTNS